MNTGTGVIRELRPEEPPADNEVELSAQEEAALRPLSPAERLAWWFGGGSLGKDRSAAHRGQSPAAKARARKKRKLGRSSSQRNRRR